jgi:hypothetical protein
VTGFGVYASGLAPECIRARSGIFGIERGRRRGEEDIITREICEQKSDMLRTLEGFGAKEPRV